MGASFIQVFFFEVLFSSAFFACFARSFLRGVRPTQVSHWLSLLGIGLATIGVGNFLFLSYSLGPVSIPATLMFLYLPVVYFFSLILGHQKLKYIKVVAIGLILLGAVLTTELLTTLGQPGVLAASLAAFAAAMSYALVFILTPSMGAFTTLEFRSFCVSAMGLIGCVLILLCKPDLWFDLGELWPKFLIFAVFLGIVGQTLPVITLMKGLPLTGSSLGGVLASIELPIAVFSAAILLGENLNPGKVLGVFLVILGISVYNFSDRKRVVAKTAA